MKQVLVIKIGTQAITPQRGEVDREFLKHLTQQIAQLAKNHHILLISSGAVGCGKRFIPDYKGKISERKAAAAIGNPILIEHYRDFFQQFGLSDAQILLERDHFADRKKFLQLRETIQELWKHNIVPICNENDVVSDFELRFSDNDELAGLLAINFSANKLLLGTSVPGLLDKNGTVIGKIENFETAKDLVTQQISEHGSGGMRSKLKVAQQASELGVEVTIFQSNAKNGLLDAAAGKTGTQCPGKSREISAHQKWLQSGAKPVGKIFVDGGARKALEDKKSLLVVGVKDSEGNFSEGDIVEIFVQGETGPFAFARTRLGAQDTDFTNRSQGAILSRPEEISFL